MKPVADNLPGNRIADHLVQEWHPTKNAIYPDQVTKGSHRMVWWKCKEGHEWETKVYQRSLGKGCPTCARNKSRVGLPLSKALLKEWNFNKNIHLKPSEFTAGSRKKVWWKCSEDHEWIAAICDRRISGCPYCYSENWNKPLDDYLLNEIHPDKNKNLDISQLTRGSNRAIWWLGKCGHEWEARVDTRSRFSAEYGCPRCTEIARPAILDWQGVQIIRWLRAQYQLTNKTIHYMMNCSYEIGTDAVKLVNQNKTWNSKTPVLIDREIEKVTLPGSSYPISFLKISKKWLEVEVDNSDNHFPFKRALLSSSGEIYILKDQEKVFKMRLDHLEKKDDLSALCIEIKKQIMKHLN